MSLESFIIRSQTPIVLNSLADVDTSVLAVGEVLTWDGAKWINQVGGGGGAETLEDLTDVIITAPSTNQVLTWNGSEWINQSINLSVETFQETYES